MSREQCALIVIALGVSQASVQTIDAGCKKPTTAIAVCARGCLCRTQFACCISEGGEETEGGGTAFCISDAMSTISYNEVDVEIRTFRVHPLAERFLTL